MVGIKKVEYGKKQVLSTSDAIAYAVRFCEPKVTAVYPITPQTWIAEKITELINNGEMDSELILVESEHSSCSAILGAAATGVRTFSATSSQGLALMNEVLHVLSGMRLPSVFAIASRALSSPINIWADHSDMMNSRDTSWIQLFCESAQEAHDTIIQAYKISEKALLPVFVVVDGYTLSHVYEPVFIETKQKVKSFIGDYKPTHAYLNPKKPMTQGPIGYPSEYMDFKLEQQRAMNKALNVIKETNRKFKIKFGRSYGNGLIDERVRSKRVIIAMGSMCTTLRGLEKKYKKTKYEFSLIKIKSFRPFPKKELLRALSNATDIAVIDRAMSYGNAGPLFIEVSSALGEAGYRKRINNFIVGLGGREARIKDFEFIIKNIGRESYWINVNGGKNISFSAVI